jgi:hypothetical protein
MATCFAPDTNHTTQAKDSELPESHRKQQQHRGNRTNNPRQNRLLAVAQTVNQLTRATPFDDVRVPRNEIVEPDLRKDKPAGRELQGRPH